MIKFVIISFIIFIVTECKKIYYSLICLRLEHRVIRIIALGTNRLLIRNPSIYVGLLKYLYVPQCRHKAYWNCCSQALPHCRAY